jgi:hypothetical protein
MVRVAAAVEGVERATAAVQAVGAMAATKAKAVVMQAMEVAAW